jgi:iron(III) transport system ATP-binding protein
MAGLTIRGLTKRFGAAPVIAGIDLALPPGELLAVLGPSGCGKTTLLRLIAGFERASSGEIRHGERLLSAPDRHVPPEERGFGIVFQSYALWPHMNVGRNIGYPLEVRGLPRAERERRVSAALERIGLVGFAERRPAELSGGQRQRVALARCLVMEADLVLLDEPLSSLDVHLRASLQDAFAEFHRTSGAAMLYITHDQAEAMALADRVAVMEEGGIVQLGTPTELYRTPATAMVARFVGQGGVVPARLISAAAKDHALVSLLGYQMQARAPATARPGPVELCLRAAALRPAARGETGFRATVRRLLYQGDAYLAEIVPEGLEGTQLAMRLPLDTVLASGQSLAVAIADAWVIPPT